MLGRFVCRGGVRGAACLLCAGGLSLASSSSESDLGRFWRLEGHTRGGRRYWILSPRRSLRLLRWDLRAPVISSYAYSISCASRKVSTKAPVVPALNNDGAVVGARRMLSNVCRRRLASSPFLPRGMSRMRTKSCLECRGRADGALGSSSCLSRPADGDARLWPPCSAAV